MSEPTWYVREKGRVTGPFTRKQLESLQVRGRLGRFTELSTDRETWRRASEAFAPIPAPATSAATTEAAGQAAPAGSYEVLGGEPGAGDPDDPREAYAWYYARGKTPTGPVRYSELRRLAAAGELTPRTKVWNETMPEWEPASQVTDFAYGTPVAPEGPLAPPSSGFGRFSEASARAEGTYPTVPADASQDERPTSGLAITGFLLGLLSWILSGALIVGTGVLSGVQMTNEARGLIALSLLGGASGAGILGIVFSGHAVSRISGSSGRRKGMGLAIAGLVLSILVVFLWTVALLGVVAGVFSAAATFGPRR
jgi:hypothetical protein